MAKIFLKVFSFMILAILFTGCAPKKLPEIIWPLPPDQPRVRFDRSFNGAQTFHSTSISVMDVVLGEEPLPGFSKPNGIHVDREGRIFITDTGFGMVLMLDPKSKASTTLTAGGRSPFAKPVGVTTDVQGNIYVSDSASDIIYVFNRGGDFIKALGMKDNKFRQPVGLAADPSGKRLYIVDTHEHHVVVLDPESENVIMRIGKRGREDGEFNFPSQITVDSKGNIYVVDTMNGRVQIFDLEGRFVRAFGRLGDGPGMFARPKGIAVDSEGHIYVVDSAFNNVQIFDAEGQILLAFGGFGEGRGEQILPAGLAIDSEDRIYLVDQWNARVNIYEYMGKKYEARKGKSP